MASGSYKGKGKGKGRKKAGTGKPSPAKNRQSQIARDTILRNGGNIF